MNRHDYAELYLKGWENGDVATCMQALADDFVFHNPRVGKVTKPQFEAYFSEMMKSVDAKRVQPSSGPFMEYEDLVTQDDGTTLTRWAWWRIAGTAREGAAVTKTTDRGVVSHRVAYHSAPQW
jgi:hypothetical protein